jgi:hypothetical protein
MVSSEMLPTKSRSWGRWFCLPSLVAYVPDTPRAKRRPRGAPGTPALGRVALPRCGVRGYAAHLICPLRTSPRSWRPTSRPCAPPRKLATLEGRPPRTAGFVVRARLARDHAKPPSAKTTEHRLSCPLRVLAGIGVSP